MVNLPISQPKSKDQKSLVDVFCVQMTFLKLTISLTISRNTTTPKSNSLPICVHFPRLCYPRWHILRYPWSIQATRGHYIVKVPCANLKDTSSSRNGQLAKKLTHTQNDQKAAWLVFLQVVFSVKLTFCKLISYPGINYKKKYSNLFI